MTRLLVGGRSSSIACVSDGARGQESEFQEACGACAGLASLPARIAILAGKSRVVCEVVSEVTMKPLEPSERSHVQAAKGWLELGNLEEAESELKQIPAVCLSHPEVLQLRWRILGRKGDWKACLKTARRLKQSDSTHLPGWLHTVTSLERLGRTSEARRVLGEAIDYFGQGSRLAFHMAELCAHGSGVVSEARHWLGKAMDLAVDARAKDWLRLEVLRDPQLEALWVELQGASQG